MPKRDVLSIVDVFNDVRHNDENTLSEFLASLMDYTPTIRFIRMLIPDELVEHYLAKSGFQCPYVRITRKVAVAAQKFVSDIATDALQ
ncbi:putative transcription initiation factor TFIID, 23-30kDa subunit [Helianthus annuus]|nr:putative transcription initiation factor TFIID, 23-30kDa subunit [Helianthus annuus]